MKNRNTFLSIIVICLLFLVACYSTSSTSSNDYTYLYDDSQKLIKPKLKVYHHSSDSSMLYFQIDPNDILYGKIDSDTTLNTKILMRYRIYEDKLKGRIIDSSTLAFSHQKNGPEFYFLQSSTSIYLPYGRKYKLQLLFRDVYKDLNVAHNYKIDKSPNGNNSYYLIKQNEKIQFQELVSFDSPITIYKSSLINESKYQFDTSGFSFKMTPPPFITQVPSPNISFGTNAVIEFNDSLTFTSINRINRLTPLDSTLRRFYFYNFHDNFPLISKVSQLTEPIRYISTSSEYKKVREAINPKKEVDQFWLSLGKEPEKTKLLIKEYYSRVERANKYFSTYREGWKTDRGIIYIVYGKPTTIYKTLEKESWIYGEENNILSIKFTFTKISTEESDNLFILERNTDFKNNWYRAVDDWRKGRINS